VTELHKRRLSPPSPHPGNAPYNTTGVSPPGGRPPRGGMRPMMSATARTAVAIRPAYWNSEPGPSAGLK